MSSNLIKFNRSKFYKNNYNLYKNNNNFSMGKIYQNKMIKIKKNFFL
jgi:hypothetical protein